jgi:hypothetical protein
LFVRLIERLAIVCVSATTNFRAATEPDFQKPVWIRKRLTSQTGEISFSSSQNSFRLLKGGNSTAGNNRSAESCGVYRSLDRRNLRNISTEGSDFVRKRGRHAFITALARIRINCLPNFRLLRIFKFSTF